MNLIQRRHERYKIFYIWKIINGLCPNYGLKWSSNDRRGTLVDIPVLKSKVPAYVKTIRDQSLTVHGGRLFNSLPSNIRNCTENKESFKILLDEFLNSIPDKPESQGFYPEPICYTTCKQSNSIIDWIRYLNISNRRPHLTDDDSIGV